MRLLFLASYFPSPSKPLIGTWALAQAMALANEGDLRVVSCVPFVPGILGMLPRARGWTQVPHEHVWPAVHTGEGRAPGKGVRVTYLRGLYYPVEPLKSWAHRNPHWQIDVAWWSLRRRVLAIIDEFRPEVIYCHHTAVNGYFAQQIHALRGIPFVVTDHDYLEITDCALLPRRFALAERVKSQAFSNVCVSQRMENDTRRLFPKVPATTIYNGINPLPPEIFSTPRPEDLRGKQVVLSVGMFAKRKAFPLLVEAFKTVAERHPQAVLRIIGDGEDRPAIEAAIARHNLQGRVTLLGLQPQSRVFQEMAWADLFALIGWDEPFATVFVEAMGAGLPVITASDGGITDVVDQRVHGLIVPPKDVGAAGEAMNELLSDEQGRRAMGQRAKALVESRLTWSANARRMYALFRDAVAASGPKS